MATAKTDAFQYRCPFCLEEDKAMVDPRLLPCKHEVCLPCLQDYIKGRADPRCEQCGISFDPNAVGDLPKLLLVPCKTCASKGNDVTAVSFCLQCNKPMCHQHTEIHHAAHEDDNHEVLNMFQYQRVWQKLKTYLCSKHPSMKLDGRCSKCLEFDCTTCRSFPRGNCPKGGIHTSEPLSDVEGRLREQLERIQSALDSLIVRKKMASDKLTASDRRCDALRHEVVELSEQQIKGAVHIVSQQINSWSNDNRRRLKEDSSRIDQKLGLMQQLSQKAKCLLTETHNLDVLKGELDDQLKRYVNEALKEMPDITELAEKVLVQKVDVQFRLVNMKPVITVTKKIPVKAPAYCVSHTADGQLVVGRLAGFDFLDESGEIMCSVKTPSGSITGLSVYQGYVYVIHKAPGDGSERQVQKYSLQGKKRTSWKVLDFQYISHLAIVQNRLYTKSDGDNLLLAYSLTGKKQPEYNIPLPAVTNPNYLCAAPPDGLIISDHVNNLVAKYTTSGQQMWTYKCLKNPTGASIDEYNRVWIGSSEGMIHIISPSGQFICELTHPGLKALLHLSVSRDQLACVAGHTDGLLYRVEYC